MDETTDVRKILASSPFNQSLIDEQMNTDYEPVSRDATSPSRDRSANNASQKPMSMLDGNYCLQVLVFSL